MNRIHVEIEQIVKRIDFNLDALSSTTFEIDFINSISRVYKVAGEKYMQLLELMDTSLVPPTDFELTQQQTKNFKDVRDWCKAEIALLQVDDSELPPTEEVLILFFIASDIESYLENIKRFL